MRVAGSSAAAAMGSAGAPNAVNVAALYLTCNCSRADDSTTSGDSQSMLDGGKLNIPDSHILDLMKTCLDNNMASLLLLRCLL